MGCCNAAAGILLGLWLLGPGAQAQPRPDGPSASVVADLDGDGQPDRVSLAVVAHRVVLEARIAGRKQARVDTFAEQDFGCSPVTWTTACAGVPVVMRAVAMDADFRRDFAMMFDLGSVHLSSRKGAQAVVIPLSGTDPFWVYWDPTLNGVARTRL